MACPSKLTPELQKKIVDLVRAGNYASTAAQVNGIGEKTFHEWMHLGKDPKNVPHVAFRQAVLAARAEAEVRAVRAVVDGFDDAKTALEYLARTRSKRWSPKQKTQVDIKADLSKMSLDELKAAFVAEIAKAERGASE